jgi:hypothetical protein
VGSIKNLIDYVNTVDEMVEDAKMYLDAYEKALPFTGDRREVVVDWSDQAYYNADMSVKVGGANTTVQEVEWDAWARREIENAELKYKAILNRNMEEVREEARNKIADKLAADAARVRIGRLDRGTLMGISTGPTPELVTKKAGKSTYYQPRRPSQPNLNLPEREVITPSRRRSEPPPPTRDLDPKREISLEDD